MSFVGGVQITGSFPVVRGHLRPTDLSVEGSRAARGTVRVGAGSHVSGTLGGRHFNVSLAKVKLASVGNSVPMILSGLNLRFPAPPLARLP
jgi:hypothetical protein